MTPDLLKTLEEWRDDAIRNAHPSAMAWMAAVGWIKVLEAERDELRESIETKNAVINDLEDELSDALAEWFKGGAM